MKVSRSKQLVSEIKMRGAMLTQVESASYAIASCRQNSAVKASLLARTAEAAAISETISDLLRKDFLLSFNNIPRLISDHVSWAVDNTVVQAQKNATSPTNALAEAVKCRVRGGIINLAAGANATVAAPLCPDCWKGEGKCGKCKAHIDSANSKSGRVDTKTN
jgi:hypothetical protein